MHHMSAALLKGGKDSPKEQQNFELDSDDDEQVKNMIGDPQKLMPTTPKFKILMQGIVKEAKGMLATPESFKLTLTD